MTLNRTGSGFVLSNGLLTVSIANNGQVTQVAQGTTNMMAAGNSMYFSESAGGGYVIDASSSGVLQQTPELVELSFVDTSGAPHDLDWDLHYVMRRGGANDDRTYLEAKACGVTMRIPPPHWNYISESASSLMYSSR